MIFQFYIAAQVFKIFTIQVYICCIADINAMVIINAKLTRLAVPPCYVTFTGTKLHEHPGMRI